MNEKNNTVSYERIINALNNTGLVPTIINKPLSFDMGSVKAEILQPTHEYENVNDNSIVLLLTYGNKKMLLTGDIEEKAIDDLLRDNADVINIDVLKVGHHGSSTSTSQELLTATTPEIAVISCGKDNGYGHPHAETMRFLEQNEINIFRTDQDGDIAIFTDGNEISAISEFLIKNGGAISPAVF